MNKKAPEMKRNTKFTNLIEYIKKYVPIDTLLNLVVFSYLFIRWVYVIAMFGYGMLKCGR